MQPVATDKSREVREQPASFGAAVTQTAGSSEKVESGNKSLWEKYPGLVWSNRHADDGVRIRAALMRPLFPILLDIAVRFGLERLELEWSVLRADSETDTRRVEPIVSRILANLRRGYEQARN